MSLGSIINIALTVNATLTMNSIVTLGHNLFPSVSCLLLTVCRRLSSGHFAEVLIETNGCEGQDNEINFVEHVQLVLTLSYSKRGAISVTLVSPSGQRHWRSN